MANYTRNTLSGVLSPVNSELEKIEVSLQKKLDRAPSVSQPNQLEDVLDANSNRIINLAPPESPNDAARLKDLQESGNSSGIPPQEGQAGEFLKTDGQTAFWDVVDKDSLGLGNVDNTSDVNKPISAATQSELSKKASHVQTFSGLASLSPSTNDVFVCTERANAEYIVQPSGYVALAGDVTFANGLVGKLQLTYPVKAGWFGVTGDGVTDDYAALVSAKTRADGGGVDISGLDILISQEFTLDSEGEGLIGINAGSFFDGTNRYKTRIASTSETGSVIRIKKENCFIKGVLVDSSGARLTAAKDDSAGSYNAGIRVEADDVAAPEGDVFGTLIENVHTTNQPNDGIIIVGRCYNSEVRKFQCSVNKGNGLVITNGEMTGRTNTATAGIVTISEGECKLNEGHGLRIGSYNSTDYALRITLNNTESLNNCGTPALLEDDAESFIHCDGLVSTNQTSTATDKNGTANANAGITLMGLGGTLLEPRLLSVDEPIRILKHPSRDSQGWTVTNPHIRGHVSTYGAYIDAGVENVNLWFGDETGTLVTATNITGVNGLTSYINGEFFRNGNQSFIGSLKDANGLDLASVKGNNLNITTTPTIVFDASEVGAMWQISGRHTGDPCLSSFTATVVGGTTPVVSALQNQAGATVDYLVTVSGADIELATSAGTRSSDVFIKKLTVA